MRSRRWQGQGYRDIAAEEFDNTADLLAEILSRGVSLQLKRGSWPRVRRPQGYALLTEGQD